MDFLAILKFDLNKGYSKRQLELLIGLPQNSLSGILKGDKKLSKKSEIKIERWEVSEKPDPLNVKKAPASSNKATVAPKKKKTTKVPPTTQTAVSGAEKHELWKQGDPKEGSGAFFMKYGCSTYDEIKNKP